MSFRYFLSFCFLFFGILLSAWAQTAAEAAAVIRAEKGDAIFQQLVEVRGERGEPDPPGWTFLFNDPQARGGIREIVVQNQQILSERTPVRGFGGVRDMPTLPSAVNLDTRAVFRAANAAALRQGVGFHWIDATLRMDALRAEPVWFVALTDYLGVRVGTIELQASTLEPLQGLQVDRQTAVEEATTAPRHSSLGMPEGGVVGQTEQLLQNTVQTGRRGALTVAGTVEEFLFGERTIGVEEE